jgi:PAS domain S-box-containing protein
MNKFFKTFFLTFFLCILNAYGGNNTSILKLTDEEKEWLKEHPVITVQNEKDWPPFNFNKNGAPGGVSIDYMNLLAGKLNIKVKYITGKSWNDYLDMMKDKKLDVILNIVKTPERQKYILYTEPYIENPNVLVSLKDKPYENIQQLTGKTVAIQKGFFYEEVLSKSFPNIKQLQLQNTSECLKAVTFGKADAMFGELAVVQYLIEKGLFTNIKVSGEVNLGNHDLTNLRIGVRKDWPTLQTILIKAMKNVTSEEMAKISKKWLAATDWNKIVQLTTEEQEWLKQHPIITFSGDPGWMPQESFTKDGKYIGIAADYLKIIENKLNIKFNIIPSSSWDQTLQMAKNHTVDIISETANDEGEKYLNFTKDYIHFPVVVVLDSNEPPIRDLNELEQNKKVCIVSGYGYVPKLKQKYPKLNYVESVTVKEGLMLVALGQADAFVGSISTVGYLIPKLGIKNLKIAGETPVSIDLAYGVRKDWPILVSILNKAINSISQEEINEITGKWITTKFIKQVDYSVIWKILLIALTILIVIIIWAYFLKREIKNRKKAEEHFSSLVANIPGVVSRFKIDNNWSMIFISKEIEALCGYPYSDFTQGLRKFISIIHPEDRKRTHNNILQSVKTKKPYTHEYRIIDKKNKIHWVLAKGQAIYDKYGKPNYLDGMIFDITEKKLLEDSHQKNRRRLQTILDNAKVVISMKDNNGVFLVVNKYFEEVIGIKKENVIGKKFTDLFPNDDLTKRVSKFEEEILSSGKIKTFEEELPHPDGSIHSYITTQVPLFDNDNNTYGLCAIATDITEVKDIQKELNKAKKIAEEATKAKGDFLANMSHEIRTPMNAILGLNYLQQKTDLNHKQDEYARKIEYSAKNLLGIINDILDFSKIEAGKLDIEEIDFNLNDVLDNLSNMMSVKAQEKEIELIIVKDKKVPSYFIGDPLRLGQVLINLSTNAIKFTDKGEVKVKVETVKLNKKSVTLKFSVSDTGIGLSEEQKNKLFQSFQQADTSTTRKYGGTGLGLSISKKLVELMNGNIGVDSVVGKGSTFYFTASFAISEKKKGHIQVIPEIIQNLKVLIVDDNETVIEVLSDYCRDFKFIVQTAGNGKEALEILKKDPSISVVLMDWKMPVMDGLEASRRIKNDPKIKPKPKIIMITNYGREEISTQAEKIGLDGFLIKPVNQSLLLDTVVQAFGETITSKITTQKKKKKTGALESIRGVSLLLVEDNEINQQVAVELLESEGLTVEVADNGKIAVDMITNNRDKYSLVFMDLQMPVMDGYTAVEHIRSNKDFDSLPIIAMTADAMSGVQEKVLSIGMNDYITKPINVDELYKTLLKWIKPEDIKDRPKKEKRKKVEKNTPLEILLPKIPGIDIKSGLKRLAGNKKLYMKILQQFAENNREFSRNVLKAVESKDQELSVRAAHTLKGVAGNIGATDLFTVTKDLEGMLHENFPDLDTVKKLLDKVNELLIPLVEAIDELRKKQEVCKKAEVSDLDLEKVKQAVVELKTRLEEYSAESSESFDNLKDLLSGHGFEMQIIELEKHINAYDFENAVEVLEKLSGIIKM